MSTEDQRGVRTILVHAERHTRLQVLDAAFWPPIGAEVLIPRVNGGLNDRFEVLRVLLELAGDGDPDDFASIIVEVGEQDEALQWVDRPLSDE